MNKNVIGIFIVAVACGPLVAQADAVAQLESDYFAVGAKEFSASRGEALWNKTFTDKKSGKTRSCGTCHGDNLRQAGKHARTKKLIKPMAPSTNPKRLITVKKIEKWFKRNCKWTVGRECTVQEKGDLLAFLKGK
ncbi:MAG: DUF1924 domain-containing protein [Candidatus Sedimenticola sp. (ex Thyasira tokunagai)]